MLTPKQTAVVLIRNWNLGGEHPLFVDYEGVTEVMRAKKLISLEKYEKVRVQVQKILDPFEARINKLYEKISDDESDYIR
jgi:hypothetical protein